MIESSIARNGQTTLPKVVRETLGLKAGDRVRYIISDAEVRILPVRPMARLFGALRYDGPTISVDEMEQSVTGRAVEE